MNINSPIFNERVLRLHAENAAFLAAQLDLAQDGPNWRLVDIHDLESRLDGHLEALVRSGPVGHALALEQAAANPGHGELFAAFHLGLHASASTALEDLLPGVGLDAGMASALGAAAAWCRHDRLEARMRRWIGSAEPLAVLTALEVCGQMRAPAGQHLVPLLAHRSPDVRARAARLAGELGRTDALPALLGLIGSEPDGTARLAAAWGAALLGDRGEAPRMLSRELVAGLPTGLARLAAELLPLVQSGAAARETIRTLGERAETRRWAVVAAGSLGAPETLDWLIRKMDEPTLARVAGAAFCLITGARLGAENLELAAFPEDPENPSVDDDLRESFIETHLYWPDPERLRAWLQRRRPWPADERLLLGVAAWTHQLPFQTPDRTQAEYRALALDIACRRPDAPLPNWRAAVRAEDRGFSRDWQAGHAS